MEGMWLFIYLHLVVFTLESAASRRKEKSGFIFLGQEFGNCYCRLPSSVLKTSNKKS